MPLNTSGPISLAGTTDGQSIALELGESATGTISLNDSDVRDLAGVASGAIVMPTNFYGASSGPTLSLGSPQSTGITGTSYTAMEYDSYRDRLILFYGKFPSIGLFAKTATISGTSVSYAAETTIWNNNSSSAVDIGVTYRFSDECAVVFWKEYNNNGRGLVTTVRVNSSGIPSRGATAAFNSGTDEITIFPGNVASIGDDISFVVYRNNDNSQYGEMQASSASFSSVSNYNTVVFNSAATSYASTAYGINGTALVAYTDGGNSDKGTAKVASITSQPTFGSAVIYSDAQTEFNCVAYVPFFSSDSGTQGNKYVVIYETGNDLKARVGTISGTSVSFGTEVIVDTKYTTAFSMSASWNPDDEVLIVSWEDRQTSGNNGKVAIGTIDGTDISFSGLATFESGNVNYTSQVYDPDTDQTLIAYVDVDDSNTPKVLTANVAT